MTAAAAAELAATRKEVKYVELSTTQNFVPLAFESLGPIGYKAMAFLEKLDIRNGQPYENCVLIPAPVYRVTAL